MKKIITFASLIVVPISVFAQTTTKVLLGKISGLILNPLIILGFVLATVYLFYSIVELIWGADQGDLDKKKSAVFYGVFGLFVMFSVYGILRLVLATFNIPCTLFFCPN